MKRLKTTATGDIIPPAYYDFELDLSLANMDMVENLYGWHHLELVIRSRNFYLGM